MKNRLIVLMTIFILGIALIGCSEVRNAVNGVNPVSKETGLTEKSLPRNPDDLLNQARTDANNGDYYNSARAYEAYRSKDVYTDEITKEYGLVLISLNRASEAEALADEILQKNEHSTDGIVLKASCLRNSGKDEEARKLLYKALEYDSSNRDIVSAIIDFHDSKGDYKACVSVYKDYLKSSPEDVDALIELAYYQMDMKKYDDAQVSCEKAISINKNSAPAYNALGNVYADKTEYKKAVEYYTKAYEIDNSFPPARTNILWGLYNGSYYENCIEESLKQAELGNGSYDLYYYLGASYEELNQPDKAKEAYNKALEFQYDDKSDVYYHLALIEYNRQNYKDAVSNTEKALEANPQNDKALWLIDQLDGRSVAISKRLGDFIESNYLYKAQTPKFQNSVESLKLLKGKGLDEVVRAAGQTLHPNDPFSFFIIGKEYEEYSKEKFAETVTHTTVKVNGKSCELFKITAFNTMTGKNFITLADKINQRNDKVLIFDLRGNMGGDMKASSEILDYLLGDCSTVSFIDRDGYTTSYYSSADKTVFRKIIILTDKNTASAAELLTLGLKVYQTDTLIIGDTTFGKGVSQTVFDDPENKVALYLVNTYWNVREINIHGYGISPDKQAKTQAEYDLALQNALNVIQ